MALLEPGTVKALLLDIGGVVLTKGWGRESRKEASVRFSIDHKEMEEGHHAALPVFEDGHITLDQYLDWVVFYEERNFSPKLFKEFMISESRPYPDALDFFKRLKAEYGLKIVALSNEGRELAVYRVREFGLASLFDCFVFSYAVGTRKPDPNVYRLALEVAHLTENEVIYIDDTPVLADAGRTLGIPTICHTDIASTKAKLAEMGISLERV